MIDLDRIIKENLEASQAKEDAELVRMFDEMYSELEESRKSNLVRILIGHGAITKENGKLIKKKREGNKVLKGLGINTKKKK